MHCPPAHPQSNLRLALGPSGHSPLLQEEPGQWNKWNSCAPGSRCPLILLYENLPSGLGELTRKDRGNKSSFVCLFWLNHFLAPRPFS